MALAAFCHLTSVSVIHIAEILRGSALAPYIFPAWSACQPDLPVFASSSSVDELLKVDRSFADPFV